MGEWWSQDLTCSSWETWRWWCPSIVDRVHVDVALGVEGVVYVTGLRGHGVGVRVLSLQLGIYFRLISLGPTARMAALQLRIVAEENRLWSISVHSFGLARPFPRLEMAHRPLLGHFCQKKMFAPLRSQNTTLVNVTFWPVLIFWFFEGFPYLL